MSHICFLHSASKLGKQKYISTHFVAKGMDTIGSNPEHVAEEQGSWKPLCCDISTWPLWSSLPPVQGPDHVALVRKYPAAGSGVNLCLEGAAHLPAQPSGPTLTYSLGRSFQVFSDLTLPHLSSSLLLPQLPTCHPPTHPLTRGSSALVLMQRSCNISSADITRRSVRDEKSPRETLRCFISTSNEQQDRTPKLLVPYIKNTANSEKNSHSHHNKN